MRPVFFKTTLARGLAEGGSETEVYLNSLNTIKENHTLAMSDIGDILFLVINPRGDNREVCSVTDLNTAVTPPKGMGLQRGYNFYSLGQSADRKKQHSAGEVVIITNDDHYLSTQYAALDAANVWNAIQTFATFPKKSGPLTTTNMDEFITYQQLVLAGLGSLVVDQVAQAETAGQTLAAGNLCYFRELDQRWWKATAATVDQQQTTQDGTIVLGEANATTKKNQIAQSFVAGQNTLTGVKLHKLADTGSFTGTVTVELLADSAGSPSGAALATVTLSNAAWLALSAGLFTATFGTAYQAAIGTTYWIRITTSTADNSNHPNLGVASSGGYASGSVKSWNTTDGWVAVALVDLTFKVLCSQTVQGVRLGFAQAAATAGNTVNMLRAGVEKNQTGMTLGSKYYASNTPGAIATTPGDTTVFVGNADTATKLIVDFRFEDLPTADQKAALAGASGTAPSATNLFIDSAALTGLVLPFAAAAAPTGWLLCDGSAVSRTTYAALFASISTTYGVGDGSTTFNVPNLKNRTPVGLDTSAKVVLFDCETAFNEQVVSNVTQTADSTDFKVGFNSAKFAIGSSFTTGIIGSKAVSSFSLAGKSTVSLWIKSDVACSANDLQLLLDDTANCASPLETINLPALLANVWTRIDLTLASAGNDTAIISIGLKLTVDKGAQNVWVDDIATGNNFELGRTGGEKSHVLVTNELASHNHDLPPNVGGTGQPFWQGSGAPSHTEQYFTGNRGGDLAHNNLQPFVTLNYIIKT